METNELIPADPNQCQSMKPNGNTFMTLGGVPGRVRCKEKPHVIAFETVPGKDGLMGEMSLCKGCLEVFKKQVGLAGYDLRQINQPEPAEAYPYDGTR